MVIILKSIGRAVAGAAILFALVVVVIFFNKGGVWLGNTILPRLINMVLFVLALNLLMVPLLLCNKTKHAAAIGLVVSSYVYGLTAWFWGLLLTYSLWGVLAVIVGLFLLGVGVVPIALLATALKGQWPITGKIFLLVLLTFVSRMVGFHIAEQEEISR